MQASLEQALDTLRQTPEATPENLDALTDAAAAEAAAKLLETKLAIGATHAAALAALTKQRKEAEFIALDACDVKLAVLKRTKKMAIRTQVAAGLWLAAIKAEQDRATVAHRTDAPAKFSLSP
jgi:hypothetical protein